VASLTDREKIMELCRAYQKRSAEEKRERLKDLTPEQLLLLEHRYADTSYYHDLIGGFSGGTYKKPSEFVLDRLSWAFGTIIAEEYRASVLWAVDACINWPYSTGWERRPMRSGNYILHSDRIFSILRDFSKLTDMGVSLADILTGNLPEDLAAYANEYAYHISSCYADAVAYELTQGSAPIEQAVRDIINGESRMSLSRTIIEGIVKSENAAMHELLGKLLLAARLQEGLRQAICEACDMGTISAFHVIIKTILDNNLIRFSSVRRAVGVWLGLISMESGDLTRISDKSISMIYECLYDEEVRKKYLAGEDSMGIHIALWAYGVYNVENAVRIAIELAQKGSHHQILTSGYFINVLNDPTLKFRFAKYVLALHGEENDILALFIDGFAGGLWRVAHFRYGEAPKANTPAQEKKPVLTDFFKDADELNAYHSLFVRIYQSMKKKKLEFSPCIFPWYAVTLKKSDLANVICMLSRLTENQANIDYACTLLPETDPYQRSSYARMLLHDPQTPAQRDALNALLGDRESSTAAWAYNTLKDKPVEMLNFQLIEDMLRFKTSDIRSHLVEFMLRQEDNALFDSVSQLLRDKLEEKRCAALDIILQLSKDTERADLTRRCAPLLDGLTLKGSKEKVLLETVSAAVSGAKEDVFASLFTDADAYVPALPDNAGRYADECLDTFLRFFPDSSIREMLAGALPVLSADCTTAKEARADYQALSDLIEEHKEDTFTVPTLAEQQVLGYTNVFGGHYRFSEDMRENFPLMNLWQGWYDERVHTPERLMRVWILSLAYTVPAEHVTPLLPYVDRLLGKGFSRGSEPKYEHSMQGIVNHLLSLYITEDEKRRIAFAVIWWMLKGMPEKDLVFRIPKPTHMYYGRLPSEAYTDELHFTAELPQIAELIEPLTFRQDESFPIIFNTKLLLQKRMLDAVRTAMNYSADKELSLRDFMLLPHDKCFAYRRFEFPKIHDYIYAAKLKMLGERTLFHAIFGAPSLIAESIQIITSISAYRQLAGRTVSQRADHYYWMRRSVRDALITLTGKEKDFTDEENALIDYIDGISRRAVEVILHEELRRGDTPARYSHVVTNINRVYGQETLIAILAALGNDALRENNSGYTPAHTKRSNLIYLLGCCLPNEGDNADTLRALAQKAGISRQRLIEAALYSPEWIDMIGECLNLPGFKSAAYYFMAHMNESFDEQRKAIIAQFTPLTADELNQGAFDLNWFRAAYAELGEADFDMIYDAAKYISYGALHTRARKYADAALGRLDVSDTEAQISAKRNKDLLLAYPVIPLSDEADISRRYLFLQNFLKGSRQFGAQRIASEKKCVEIALTNLAINAGFTDVMHLTLRMEARLIDQNRTLFEPQMIDEITACLSADENGQVDIVIEKGGKKLKSVPAKFKKHEYILRLSEMKKAFTEQRRRTVHMFEESMENGTAFTAGEIALLAQNPVLAPVVTRLVFVKGDAAGFVKGGQLLSHDGTASVLNESDSLIVAHPFHLYTLGQWTAFQRCLFDRKIIQPFRQVFRELYIKTADELGRTNSLRYSGNQLQPAKTVGCLKSRRWVADVESGLQKVYYKENIIAHIYALADWFSPADIECPALEWVEFTDRRTGKPLKIDDVPNVIFSEIMRDVDMAVSVAHAGGVDPETSHSTVEMRAAILEHTLPLFGLSNVRILAGRALIQGSLANYSVHLGSGVIHQEGGAMISVLPVHSQHRGKLFLPFVDEDPKTAEIISKVLLFAEDQKIKDPAILEQIRP